ncbi:MAG: LytTR family DNA-binding domain-containing protein [Eubacterium sp.]|nr:LytTR family DNA-binding domain-containing protein [Eubacterium sp.]
MYTIAICDDINKDTQYLASVVQSWAQEQKVSVNIEMFPSAESFLFHYDEKKDYDILLLDVEMKNISGIELAKQIRSMDHRVEIIFTTSHFELSGEGYEVDALHYLIKPIAETKLMEVLSKAARKLSVEPPSLVIVCNGETVKILEPDILYIESFRHYVVVHTQSTEYKLKENLSALKGKLSSDFYQTHRSYLVSLKHIRKISRTAVWLDCGAEIPLARGKYDDVNRAFIARN